MMIDIVNNLGALKVDSRKPLFVAGRVWLDIEGVAFPSEGWSDAPLSVLGSFSSALSHAAEVGEGDLYFFDGPFFVKFLMDEPVAGESMMRVCAVHETYPPEMEGEPIGIVKAEALARSAELRDSCMRRVRECAAWASERGEKEVLEVLAKIELRLSELS
jgi:hypothetical protein